ncbi:hypothetical protein OIDMADRAFT_142207 [Oidiodendron maius Zn]|uniref:Essential protein Yae1 N-terminal domain-containing protein n=1 Tax=Oidiodendron maius (strain Zn) TaxID=913774 RepID=A0A0C3HUJ9_OIDMZ|nr:hypothetical protein OIDMADRAFT_142207 [Oidiodendron maius Zn]
MPQTTFDEVLGLEEEFYEEGYQQGLADGVKAGQIEGRTFGLEKGFEKYVESGRLHGKSLVWANRTPQFQINAISAGNDSFGSKNDSQSDDVPSSQVRNLPKLPDNARIAKHIKVLYALAELESLSTENTEDAVSDFDDRLKRAHVKARIIERMAGEARGGDQVSSGDGSIEDVSVLSARH